MWFNILTQNHGELATAVPLAPLITYMRQALSICGHEVTVSYDQLYPAAVNLYLEGFHDDVFVDRLIAARNQHKLKIGMVATELMINGTIPYAEHGILYGGEKARMLAARITNFERLIGEVDFTWCLLARTCEAYRKRARFMRAFPVGAVGKNDAALRRSPKDIDVVFFGTKTPHRQKVIEAMQAHGIEVKAIGRGFPAGWQPPTHLDSLLDRAKIGLNLTLHAYEPGRDAIDPRFVSCLRLVDMLARDLCVVSEVIPHDNPYRHFMSEGLAEELASICRSLLAEHQWRHLGEQRAADFSRMMDVRDLCGPVIVETMAHLD